MRATHLAGNGVVEILDVPDPTPGPGEVVIQTAISVLCGSELHAYRGHGLPHGNGGHEAAGTVVALGPGTKRLEIGQRVGVSGVVGCGHCEQCLAGRYTWCQQRLGYGSMHQQRFVTAEHACHVLPDDLPWEVGVLITGDGMGVPYHTSTRLANPAIKTVAIFGVGPIGLGNVIMETFLGRQVMVVDVSPYRLELAQRLGAVAAFNAADGDPVECVRARTAGHGADACIECAGRPETFRSCLAAVRTGGIMAINGEQPRVELSPSEDLIRRDITVFGSWFYFFAEYPEMLALVHRGLPAGDLITHRYPLAEADAAFREFAAGRTGKVALLY